MVFDACFAGIIFESARAAPPPAITRVTTEPVRQFLSSGGADQKVSDDGMFRRLFLDALAGKRGADANADGYLTASELGLFLSDRISNYTSNRQIPNYGRLPDPDYDQGDFVFRVPRSSRDAGGIGAPVSLPDSPGSGSGAVELTAETEFWKSVEGLRTAEGFRAYLRAYPQGRYVTIAELKVAALTSPATTSFAVTALDRVMAVVGPDSLDILAGPAANEAKISNLARIIHQA